MSAVGPLPVLRQDVSYPCPSKLQHVSIFSGSNFEAMLDFYQTVLNMRIVYEIKSKLRFTALSFDEENHCIGLVHLPNLEPRPSGSVRIEHTSWNYRDITALLETIKAIEKKSDMFPMAVHQGTIIAVSYKDPDGNRCELTVDCLPTQAAIIDFYTEKLSAMSEFNTLLPFNLRRMIELHDIGEPAAHFLDYEWVKTNLPAENPNVRPF
jgi:catechol 2,3-dioxygenase-like lactoylglutathione lyase family enzyme